MLDFKKYLSAIFILLFLLIACMAVSSADGEKIGTVTADVLNVREAPSLAAQVVDRIYSGGQVVVVDYSNGWYKVCYGEMSGWVSEQYLLVGDSASAVKVGIISGNGVNLRSGPSTSTGIITVMYYGERVTVLDQSENWYNIKLSSGATGWVFGDYLSIGDGISRGLELGQQVVEYAKRFLGVKYTYGGNSPSEGFDCSGFVKYVYKNFGIELARVAAEQAGQGVSVSRDSLRPGDLVFFDTDGGSNYINHVGIYMGNGSFIHSSSGSSYKVVISDINSSFYASTYMTARRLIR